jgi:hypothetical protein
MLCPDCRRPAPGGTLCPQCRHQVPERETFGGHGDHYLRVLSAFSLIFLVVFVLATGIGHGFRVTLERLYTSGWIWVYLAIFLIPIGVGLYYWSLLREEEITVTDEYIARRSHWGDERMAWSEVRKFRQRTMLFRQTRVGRITGLSRLFADHKLLLSLPPIGYELLGPLGADGNSPCICLEPGTIDDMSWLLQIIEERLGPPIEE